MLAELHSSSLSVGISILVFVLLASAMTGLYQEWLYEVCGKHPDEAMFYLHLLPLTLFGRIGTNIHHHVQLLNQSSTPPSA
jgi:solute carrier family 35 (UDP-xylose/UDP-N-acetylglucosamine transporter), member B4